MSLKMRTSYLLAAVLLVVAVAPALGDPFEDARSKKEAVAAFAGAEELLVKKVESVLCKRGVVTSGLPKGRIGQTCG